MKVITLISGGDIGGAKTHVLSLLHGLGKTEQVRLVCFREGEFAEDARKLGIDTCVMEVSVGAAIGRLTQMIREEGFQIIHCHGARANLMGMLLRRRAGIPVISTIHSDYRLDYMGRPLAALGYGGLPFTRIFPHLREEYQRLYRPEPEEGAKGFLRRHCRGAGRVPGQVLKMLQPAARG